jgi:5-methylcytosine-specific restriction endonuclease McrA
VERDGVATRPGDGGLVAESKVCGTCKQRKPVSEFSNDRSSRDGRRWRCKTCDNAYRAARRASVELPRRGLRKLTLIAMLGGRCVECGESDRSRLHFDHVDPETTVATVSELLDTGSWERILEEAAKCQLLCVDCHKPKTRSETRARTLARWVEEDKAAGRFEGRFRPLLSLSPS